MLNDDSYIIGHHGTSEEAARSILAKGFSIKLSKKENRYNSGIYFWLSHSGMASSSCSVCLAKSWSFENHNAEAAIESEIYAQDILDITEEEYADQVCKIAGLENCQDDFDAWSNAVVEFLSNNEDMNNEEIPIFISYCKPASYKFMKEKKACDNHSSCAKIAKSVIVRDASFIINRRRLHE